MAIQIVLDFDDTWAARLAPMVESRLERAERNPIIEALVEATPGVDSIDDLSVKQKGKLWILVGLLGDLCAFEGDAAARSSRLTVVADVEENFPLEFGDV